jgi:hypothetical protein
MEERKGFMHIKSLYASVITLVVLPVTPVTSVTSVTLDTSARPFAPSVLSVPSHGQRESSPALRESMARLVSTKWERGPADKPRKVTRILPTQIDRPGIDPDNVAELEAATELIVIVRPLEDLPERQQLHLYDVGDVYPEQGYTVAQVKVLKVIKKPARFRLPSSGTLPICEPLFVYRHPEAGPNGLFLRRMWDTYREMKKGRTYLLFLKAPAKAGEEGCLAFTLLNYGKEPTADIERYSRFLYGFDQPHLGKYNLDGGDPDDIAVDLEEAMRIQDPSSAELGAGQPDKSKAVVSQKTKLKNVILRRYAAYLPPKP